MNKLRLGICGLGFMGRSHFVHLRQHDRARIVAVCDQDERRRAGLWQDELGNLDFGDGGRVSMEGIASYADATQLVADPQVDAVLIALPTHLHAAYAVAALAAGKHVFCEKPMAVRVGDCDRMIAAAHDARRTLMVGHCIRFWPQYELIKRYVDGGRIGKVRFATLRRLGHAPTWSAGNWMMNAKLSGGALLDLHVHDVDFAHYLLGMPDTIYARATRGLSGGFDHVVATHAYDDGRYALLEGGWTLSATCDFDMQITVHGDAATIGWALSQGGDVVLTTPDGVSERIPCEGDAIRRELDYFIDAVIAGVPVERCTPQSSRNSVALAWLERRSAEVGRPIAVNARLRAAWEGEDRPDGALSPRK